MLGAPPGGVLGGVTVLCSMRSREAAAYSLQCTIDRSTQVVAVSAVARSSASARHRVPAFDEPIVNGATGSRSQSQRYWRMSSSRVQAAR